jgi:plasmid stabilization system protein ParE
MGLPVVFHRAARAELNEAAAWYERRRPDLGLELIGEVDHCVDLISEQPDLGNPTDKGVRRMTLRRFPLEPVLPPRVKANCGALRVPRQARSDHLAPTGFLIVTTLQRLGKYSFGRRNLTQLSFSR